MTTELEKQFFEAFDIKPMLIGYSECYTDFYGYPSVGGEVKYFETLEELKKSFYYLPLCIDEDDITDDDKVYPILDYEVLFRLKYITETRFSNVLDSNCSFVEYINNLLELCVKYKSEIYNEVRDLILLDKHGHIWYNLVIKKEVI